MNNAYHSYTYPNRTMCEVLEEMRSCFKSRNFAGLLGLIEETQSMGNRMEAGLSDQKDLKSMQEQRSKMDSKLNKLQQEIDKLTTQRDALRKPKNGVKYVAT